MHDKPDRLREQPALLGPIGLSEIIVLVLGLGFLVTVVVLMSLPPVQGAREAAPASTRKNNTKQVLLGFHNQHDEIGRFPFDVVNADGLAFLSWRVDLLPYVHRSGLYDRFRHDESWLTPHNWELLPGMPLSYGAALENEPERRTSLLRPTGPGTVVGLGPDVTLRDITDGTANTIAVVHLAGRRSVPWTKPEDVAFNPRDPHAMFRGKQSSASMHFGFFDGSARMIDSAIDPDILRQLIDPQDGEPDIRF